MSNSQKGGYLAIQHLQRPFKHIYHHSLFKSAGYQLNCLILIVEFSERKYFHCR